MSYFNTSSKGENFELRVELNSEYRDKRKEAVKRVIANMTMGKDVSSLFADVVKNMQTEDLELKKLVYLYLINYAKTQPELVILCVNTFVKDSDDHNPLIRALAIRTMGCLRSEKITNYLMEPLKKSLKDSDPYVRKTGALCVSKLFHLSPSIAIDNGLIQILQEMLGDPNPSVIANAVAALTEIRDSSSTKQVFEITATILQKLMAALNECTEWGQICILSSLAQYKPVESREAADIMERVVPRLQHANPSVLLAAIQVLLVFMPFAPSPEYEAGLLKKMTPPLVSLLSSEPEIQCVALRNIHLILQKRPNLLAQEMRVFFTKYNDPLYVKIEKLQVMIRLCSDENVDQVLSELKEYTNEVDVDFVRKSIRAISRVAIKIASSADKCVQILLDLIKTNVNYIVQETVISIKDIFRRYPSTYQGILPALCQHIEALDEPLSKASLIWMIGEYANVIVNAQELLEYFTENFKDENSTVQLQLITASVKLFLYQPGSAQGLVQKVLTAATQGTDNPDIRDRAYIYWRLLSLNPQAAQSVVLSVKAPMEYSNDMVSDALLNELIQNLSSLASVFHKPVSTVTSAELVDLDQIRDIYAEEEEDGSNASQLVQQAAAAMKSSGDNNLLDIDFGNTSRPNDLIDSLHLSNQTLPSTSSYQLPVFPKSVVLSSENGKGLEIQASFAKSQAQLLLGMTFSNKTSTIMTDFAIQMNVNSFGLSPTSTLQLTSIEPGNSVEVVLPLAFSSTQIQPMEPPNLLQIAIKNERGVYYFQTVIPMHLLVITHGCSESDFHQMTTLGGAEFTVPIETSDAMNRLSSVGCLVLGDPQTIYVLCRFANQVLVSAQITINHPTATVVARCAQTEYLAAFKDVLAVLLQN